jgi:ZIP family zinc transporter
VFLTALLVGLTASSALVIGGVLGAFVNPSQKIIAVLLGFAAGALITALAFDLFEEAFSIAGPWVAGGGLLGGAALFVASTALLDRYSSSTSGFYLLASIILDGIPENLALGVALIGKSFLGTLSLIVAIFFSNLPEALGGAVGMRQGGRSKKFAIGAWTATALLLTLMVIVGNTLFATLGETPLAFARAVAAGAVLASLAEALMPQAYSEGGKIVALATTAGFLLTFLITQ